MNKCHTRQLISEKRQMFFTGTNENIIIHCLQSPGKRDHTACVSQAPLQRTDEYIFLYVQT
jgi:hypothetical protein